MDMALSAIWMLMSMLIMSHRTLLIVLELLRNNRADLSNEKNLGEINNNNNNNNSNNNNCKCLFSS